MTVPVLVYLLGVDVLTSTAYSLFIVGSTALVGAIRSYLNDNIEVRLGLIFAIPSLSAVWLTRAYLIPAIPTEIGSIGSYTIDKNMAILIFFAFIMILSSVSMIRKKKSIQENTWSS